jgi:hypothetical protein
MANHVVMAKHGAFQALRYRWDVGTLRWVPVVKV